jgi:hypothetical protein
MVNIDTVYQRVLAIANKEQRGYITPQEFNLFANQAQLDIFEQYFYDLNQFKRIPGNDTKYSDMVDLLEEKISIFKQGPISLTDSSSAIDTTIYRITDANYNGKIVEEIRYEDYYKIQTPLTKPNTNRPVFWRKNNKVYFQGVPSGGSVVFHYIVKPTSVKWAYTVVKDKALYVSGDSTNFMLHPSEEVDLILKIAQLAGIAIKDNSLYQAAAIEERKNIEQEKR